MKRVKSVSILLIALALAGLLPILTGAEETKDKERKSPNLLFDISADAVNALVQRRVDRTEPVEEVIQDTPVHGNGRTLAAVRAELIPDATHAAVQVSLQGNVYSRTVGTRPFVFIYSSTVTSLDVRHRVVFDAKGIRIFQERTHAESAITLHDVTSREEPDAIAIRFARKGYEKYRHLAEAETACKTADHASSRLREELTPPLASISKAMGTGLSELKRVGLTVDSLDFNTTASSMQAELRIATAGKNQAGLAPMLPADIDLGLRVHESLVNEVARTALGGKSFPLNAADKFYDNTTLGLLRDGRKDEVRQDALKTLAKLLKDLGVKPAIVKLTQKDPVTVAFTNQGFNVEIHIASIHQDGVAFAGMRVQAEYRLENARDGVHAVRKGPVRFVPSDAFPAKKLAEQPASFLVVREVLFAEVMKERLTLAPLPMPDSIARLRLQAPRSGAGDGWFALAWNLARPEK
jgi:hypothetical protein